MEYVVVAEEKKYGEQIEKSSGGGEATLARSVTHIVS